MGSLKLFRKKARWKREANKTTLYECRNCGQKFATDVDKCSNCESVEIAHYEF
ncbi:hypothetical protein C492_09000 [Natronococcus jeotgali DSM 18795]|uniref:DUF35 domain-containing protein n=1 Tax=Natronococcus jeotgali DSM 18795 TaxID=1227498 RepID=L9XK70_9EURY|nr:hypothetical protein C492_09000 [Natronococcus jeotgali DSM 18795]